MHRRRASLTPHVRVPVRLERCWAASHAAKALALALAVPDGAIRRAQVNAGDKPF